MAGEILPAILRVSLGQVYLGLIVFPFNIMSV
jgi:hypothetical protein